MTAQEQLMSQAVTGVRRLVPPTLDFVVIIFSHEGPPTVSSCMFPSLIGKTPAQQYERAKEAARAFITQKPHASFNPQS